MDSPANNIFAVAITRVRGEVTDDVVIGISSNHIGGETLSRAGEYLDRGRADSPVELEGTHAEIDCVGGSGDMV